MDEPGHPHRAQTDHLQREIVEAKAALSSLRADIAQAEARLHSTAPGLLVEANEALVLAMLKAQAEVDRAAEALAAVSHSAQHDVLTRLPNRALLHDRWTQAAASAKRHGQKMAVLFIDLNHFKGINDTLGHATGDEVLAAMASRLRSCVREADTVGRYGGDEFVVLLTELSHGADADVIARKLVAALAEPLDIRGHTLVLGASIGISIYPDDAADIHDLIDLADQAMYTAKRQSSGSAHADAASSADVKSTQRRVSRLRRQPAGEQQRMIELLREANERLVVAVMSATALQEDAERALAQHRSDLAQRAQPIGTPPSPLP